MRIATFLAVLTVLPAQAQAAQPITGRYLTQGRKSVIEIAPCGRAMCGRIVRLMPGFDPALKADVHNPDPGLRGRPPLGLPILLDFTDAGADWRGRIYSPQDGGTYDGILSRNPDGSLKVKGCVMVFCRTQTWPQAK